MRVSYWGRFTNQATRGLGVVFMLLAIAAVWLFIMNQAGELSRFAERGQRDANQELATRECMKYFIPDAAYIDGKTYCIGEVQFYLGNGVTRGFRIALETSEIQEMLGTPQ